MIPAFLLLVLVFTVSPAKAGPAEEAWEAYIRGDFSLVTAIVNKHVNNTNLTSVEKAKLYLALGCSDALLGREASATAAFERSLVLNSALILTEADLPPPAWTLFKPVQERQGINNSLRLIPTFSAEQLPKPVKPDTIRILFPAGRDKSSLIKSMLLPGWGHLSEGERRGYVFLGAEFAVVSGLIYSAARAKDARGKYLKARDIEQIDKYYNRYNRYYNLTWGFGAAAVVVYFLTQLDFVRGSPSLNFRTDASGLRLDLSFTL